MVGKAVADKANKGLRVTQETGQWTQTMKQSQTGKRIDGQGELRAFGNTRAEGLGFSPDRCPEKLEMGIGQLKRRGSCGH